MNVGALTLEIMTVTVAFLALVADLIVPGKEPRRGIGLLTSLGLVAIFFFAFTQYGKNDTLWQGMFVRDDYSVFFKQVFLAGAALTIFFSLDFVDRLPHSHSEFYIFFIFALAGMMIMASANDLITLYVGLELMAFNFFILAGYVFSDSRPTEGAIKYLLLGAAASAGMLYGMSLLFGLSGVVDYIGIAKSVGSSPAMLVGGVMIVAGFAFKLAVPPFHMWAPDVYESAPVPVTAMLAMGSKAAGFAALIRVMVTVFPPTGFAWMPLFLGLAAAAMIMGNLAAIPQTNVKRLLAYSSIAQAGYMLTGLLAANVAGVKSVMVYAMLYVFANVGAFAVITAVNNYNGGETVADFSGLSKQSPLLASVMTVSLLSMAGIPPLAGFAGKFFLFTAAIDAGYLWIAVLGFVLSMVSVYYYLLIVKSMYSGEVTGRQPFMVGESLRLTAMFAAAATVFWGVYPGPLARLAEAAARTLFK